MENTCIDATVIHRTLKEIEFPIPAPLAACKDLALEARHIVDAVEMGMIAGPRRRLAQEQGYREVLVIALAVVKSCAEVGLFDWGLTYQELAGTISATRALALVKGTNKRVPADDGAYQAVCFAVKTLEIEGKDRHRTGRTAVDYLAAA